MVSINNCGSERRSIKLPQNIKSYSLYSNNGKLHASFCKKLILLQSSSTIPNSRRISIGLIFLYSFKSPSIGITYGKQFS